VLDGRIFESFHVDIGVRDPIVEKPEILQTLDLMAFADIEPVPFPSYPLTQHIAEKLRAYTRPHAGAENTHVRDFVDMLLIASMSRIDGRNLSAAITATFEVRSTHSFPGQLPDPPSSWASSFRRSAEDLELSWHELPAATQAAQAFVNPILKGAIAKVWNPETWSWE